MYPQYNNNNNMFFSKKSLAEKKKKKEFDSKGSSMAQVEEYWPEFNTQYCKKEYDSILQHTNVS
jgi:hypothetical protein